MSDKTVTPKNVIVLLVVGFLIAAGAGGMYLAEKLYYGPMREQQRLIQNLEQIVDTLTREVRIAEVKVESQTQNPLRTTFRFIEVDENGKAIDEPKTLTVDGDVAYFDAWVIKFKDPFRPLNELPLKQEKLAEPLMNKSIILFRRVFGEKQKPEDGVPLDAPGEAPVAYKHRDGKPPSDFEKKLWNQFWALANDPKLAEAHGVHAAHGEAVYMKLQPNKYYVIEQRLTGGMTIRPVDVPAVFQK